MVWYTVNAVVRDKSELTELKENRGILLWDYSKKKKKKKNLKK